MFKVNLLLAAMFLLSFTVFSQSTDPEANWNKYYSAMAGFEVKYPADWKIHKEEASGKNWRVSFISPLVFDEDVNVGDVITICSKPKGETFKEWDNCREKNDRLAYYLSDPLRVEVLSEKTFEANGLKIESKEYKWKFDNAQFVFYAFISSKDRDYSVSGHFTKSFNLDRYAPDFNKMLANFRASAKKTVTIYRNDEYDFAVSYPDSWKDCSIEKKNDTDGEQFLALVPKEENCNGANFIAVSRFAKFSGGQRLDNLKDFLSPKDFPKIIAYVEFGNVFAATGEKIDKKSIYRERYFYTNYPKTYELLRITESYEAGRPDIQQEAGEILATARQFLRNQWYAKD